MFLTNVEIVEFYNFDLLDQHILKYFRGISNDTKQIYTIFQELKYDITRSISQLKVRYISRAVSPCD